MSSEDDLKSKYNDIYKAIDKFTMSKFSWSKDMTLSERLNQLNINPNYHHLFTYWFGTEYGASSNRISSNAIAYNEDNWPDTANYAVLNMNHIDILKQGFCEALKCITNNTIL